MLDPHNNIVPRFCHIVSKIAIRNSWSSLPSRSSAGSSFDAITTSHPLGSLGISRAWFLIQIRAGGGGQTAWRALSRMICGKADHCPWKSFCCCRVTKVAVYCGLGCHMAIRSELRERKGLVCRVSEAMVAGCGRGTRSRGTYSEHLFYTAFGSLRSPQ